VDIDLLFIEIGYQPKDRVSTIQSMWPTRRKDSKASNSYVKWTWTIKPT